MKKELQRAFNQGPIKVKSSQMLEYDFWKEQKTLTNSYDVQGSLLHYCKSASDIE